MSFHTKIDFSPPMLSWRWLAAKFRPNMMLYSWDHVIAILECGLMFREDSIEVQEALAPEQSWRDAGGARGRWLTRGEGTTALVTVAACIAACPPRNLQYCSLFNMAAYFTIPVAVRLIHRTYARGALASLLVNMRDYLALARRAAACLKEYAALHAQLESVMSCIDSTHVMLCQQQSELVVSLSRACSTVLGNAPWLRGDVAWDALAINTTDLMQIHHAYLVVQSTLLKNIALAHLIPPVHIQRIYKNQNERIYWLHNVLIDYLIEEFKDKYASLERMYRLLRNFGKNETSVVRKPGPAITDDWVYSEIHIGVARTNWELRIVSNKCNALDAFLDSCALHRQPLDLKVLETDLDEIIDEITKCLDAMHHSQLRLRKMRNKMNYDESNERVRWEEEAGDEDAVVRIDDKVPEVKDEVFYLLKTEDDDEIAPVGDITTAPGKKEKEATKIVLKELKRKLGKREDVMRERERQALVKTMPELKGSVPEFPRQIKLEEFVVHKGFIGKIKKDIDEARRRSRKMKRDRKKRYKLKFGKYVTEDEIPRPYYEANAQLGFECKLIYITMTFNERWYITKWSKVTAVSQMIPEQVSSGVSETLSDVEASTAFETAKVLSDDFKFTKKDLELSGSSSESDFEFYMQNQMALLKDVRRHRAARGKRHPVKSGGNRSIDKEDESMKPIEYSFGAGMAMASVLQINSKAKMPNFVQEEVFVGDGEVSNDSGNDDNA